MIPRIIVVTVACLVISVSAYAQQHENIERPSLLVSLLPSASVAVAPTEAALVRTLSAGQSLVGSAVFASAYPQHSQERQELERNATLFFWTGVALAGSGLPLMMTVPSMGLPITIAGGASIIYGVHLNNRAKALPTTAFIVAPVRKGAAIGFSTSW